MFKKTDSLYQAKTGRIATDEDLRRAAAYFDQYGPESNDAWLASFLPAVFSENGSLPIPFDFHGLCGQFSQESNYARSTYLVRDGNPVGIGIYASGIPSPWNGKLTPLQAARVWLLELIIHVTPGSTIRIADVLAKLNYGFTEAYQIDKTHIDKVISLRNSLSWPSVNTWNDLRTPVGIDDFVWAADQDYGTGIANRVNDIWPNLKDAKEVSSVPSTTVHIDKNGTVLNMTKDLIPFPGYYDRPLPTSVNTAFDYLGLRTVKGFVLHRMLGSLWGTDNYFRGEGGSLGRTDFGQSATGTDVILWTNPEGYVSGWASGKYDGAYGDGLAFYNKYGPSSGIGANIINRDQVSWEIDGFQNDPWSDASMQIAAQACAHYAHNYGIQWDQFPIAPWDGFSFVRWHQEFTLGTGKECPFTVVMAQTPRFITMVTAIMQRYQVEGGVTVPVINAAPDGLAYPEGLDNALMSLLFGRVVHGKTVHEFTPTGTIATAWYKRGKAKGTFPRLVDTFADSTSGRSYFFFADGSIIWRPNNKVKYRWTNAV